MSARTCIESEGSHTAMSRRIVLVEVAGPLEELLHPPLLEKSHQGRLESLLGVRGHLRHGSLRSATLLHIASCYLLEVEISGDVGGDENVGQFTVGHQELGHEVDVPVVGSSIFLPGLLAGLEIAIFPEELREVRSNEPKVETAARTVSMLTDAASLRSVSWSITAKPGESKAFTLHSDRSGRHAAPSFP